MWYVDGTPSVKDILDQAWADPRGAAKNACPLGFKFFHFHAAFIKKFAK